ncbi:MAG TPA: DUF3649 domain-containing protein [Stenotrophomonas sp.]|jgi:hypothetical protein
MSPTRAFTDVSGPAWFRRPWLGVLSRSLAAIFGGYALASASAIALAMLPIAPSQAVLIGMMAGVLVCACAALWAFATSKAWRAWAGLLLPAAALYGIAWLARAGAA